MKILIFDYDSVKILIRKAFALFLIKHINPLRINSVFFLFKGYYLRTVFFNTINAPINYGINVCISVGTNKVSGLIVPI